MSWLLILSTTLFALYDDCILLNTLLALSFWPSLPTETLTRSVEGAEVVYSDWNAYMLLMSSQSPWAWLRRPCTLQGREANYIGSNGTLSFSEIPHLIFRYGFKVQRLQMLICRRGHWKQRGRIKDCQHVFLFQFLYSNSRLLDSLLLNTVYTATSWTLEMCDIVLSIWFLIRWKIWFADSSSMVKDTIRSSIEFLSHDEVFITNHQNR